MTTTLTVTKREKSQKLDNMRKSGVIPAVFYGAKVPATSISLSEVDFIKAFKQAGESTVINLKTDTGILDALIHEVDVNPVSGRVRHVDFYIVEKGKKVKVAVPLHFMGTAPAVKELGGTLTKVLHEVEIEAEAKDLPHEIEVSLEALINFDTQILAKDIVLPKGVALVTDADEVVALVSPAKEEVEAAPVDISSIEISEKKGKKEEEVIAE